MRTRLTSSRTGGPVLAAVLGVVLALSADAAAQPGPPKGVPVQPGPVQPWIPPPPPPPQSRPRSTPPIAALLPVYMIALVIWMAHLKLRQEEEEEVTPHTADSTTQVEYKIIRSGTAAFKSPVKFRAMLEEEARAGWELFEKLDCGRVRLRRPTSWRDKDADLTQDPYRTRYAGGEGKVVLIVLATVLAFGAAIAGIVLLVSR